MIDPSKEKPSLLAMTQEHLEAFLSSHGQPKFRAKQIRNWIFEQGVTEPSEMTNLPKALRFILEQHTATSTLSITQEQVSKDGTIKRLYALPDGHKLKL